MKLYLYILMATALAARTRYGSDFLKTSRYFGKKVLKKPHNLQQWFNKLGWVNEKEASRETQKPLIPVLLPLPPRITVFGKR